MKMKIDWQKIKGTKLIELSYDLTRKKVKVIIPKDISGSIVKVNFILSKDSYKDNEMDSILAKLKEKKPALVFLGKIKVKEDRQDEEEEKSLPLSLSREELIVEFAKLFAPKRLRDKIVKTAIKVLEKINA